MSHSVIRWPEMGLSHEKGSDFISGMERSEVTETFQLRLCFVFKVGVLTRYPGHLAVGRPGSIAISLPCPHTEQTFPCTLKGSLLSWRPKSSALPTELESLLSSSWPLVFGKIRSHKDTVVIVQPVFELLNALRVRSWDTAEAPRLDGCAPRA